MRSCRRTGIGFQVHHLWRRICEQTRSWLSPPSTGIHWHEVCEHPITFSDRTPECFVWNSSQMMEHHLLLSLVALSTLHGMRMRSPGASKTTRSLALLLPHQAHPLAPRRKRRPRRGRPRRAPRAPRNSSPSQYCLPRSVNVHLISAIHILYQPRKAQARTYILIISINAIIRLSTINTIITNKRNN